MNGPNSCKSLVTFSSEMDFSLLASDMQKLLSISPKVNVFEGKPSETLFNQASVSKKFKARSGAYLEDIEVHKCPLCPLSFNCKDLLARHALRVHHKAVINLLQDGSTEQHLKCRFCVHKVMHRHQKLLLLHLEKKHAVEFVAFLKQWWMPSAEAQGFPRVAMSQGHVAIGYLQQELQGMSLASSVRSLKANNDLCAIPKMPEFLDNNFCISSNEPTKSFDSVYSCSEKTLAVSSVPILADQTSNHSYAKRKLILDGTSDNRSCKGSLMKENVPPEELLITTLAGSGWKHATGKHFACGRCKEAFSCNALLLDHVSVRHRGPLRLLQPLFTCGLCSASFYKNSFLVRHCYQHHTPK